MLLLLFLPFFFIPLPLVSFHTCFVQWFEYSIYMLILVNGVILIVQTYIMDKTTQKQAHSQSFRGLSYITIVPPKK